MFSLSIWHWLIILAIGGLIYWRYRKRRNRQAPLTSARLPTSPDGIHPAAPPSNPSPPDPGQKPKQRT